ncbi:MAG: hypothetical protein ACOCP4_02300 [Candidatus Woesearchaeota archaeon]
MKFKDKDYRETDIVAEIIKKTESSSIQELSGMFDEIRKYQPILISIFLGYKDVLSDEELDELAKDLIIIWKFFSEKPNSKKIRITESHLKKFDKKNAEFFNYLSGDDSENEMKKTTEIVLEEMESKAILTALIYRVNEKSVFKKMNQDRKSEFIMEMKTLIDCFEDINK